ncbi:MAG: glycosyltransferase [Phycisphaerales bacterium JB043]
MLSFVIPAYNEAALIGRTIRSIHDAMRTIETTIEHEIVVADDASTDATQSIAREHGACVVPVEHRQIAATRNSGARHAAGKWLIFVDADTMVTPDAVRGAVDAMRKGASGGGCRVRFDGRIPLYARLMLPPMMILYRVVGIASGSFLFCTREAFERSGGFDESYYASEELWMSRAIKAQGRFVFLRAHVVTSGRKLRAHTGREIGAVMLRLALKGRRGVRRREGLDIWYGERRIDPEAHPENTRDGSGS